MSDELSPRQTDVLSFINRFRLAEQCNPTCHEISEHFGWASHTAADDHLAAMEKKGVILRRPGKARGYKVAASFQDLTPPTCLQQIWMAS